MTNDTIDHKSIQSTAYLSVYHPLDDTDFLLPAISFSSMVVGKLTKCNVSSSLRTSTGGPCGASDTHTHTQRNGPIFPVQMLHPPRLPPHRVQLGFSMRANFWCRSRRRFGRWLFSIPVWDRGAKRARDGCGVDGAGKLNWTEQKNCIGSLNFFLFLLFPISESLLCVPCKDFSYWGVATSARIFVVVVIVVAQSYVKGQATSRMMIFVRGGWKKKWKVFKSDCELSWVYFCCCSLLFLILLLSSLTFEGFMALHTHNQKKEKVEF